MSARPVKITGGRLCGSIRYEISFPEDASWPADSCTCQCSICRKWTGTLLAHDLIIKPTQLTTDITKMPTYKEYESSEAATRAFCSQCGSGLTWRMKYIPDMMVVTMGTIDEDFLLGKKVEGSEEETELGLKFKREGGLSKELCNMQMGNLFWNSVVPGVTDREIGGTKFMQSFPMD